MNSTQPIGPGLVDKKELAKLLNLSVHTISVWVWGRRIPFHRFGNGKRAPIRFNVSDVKAHLTKTRVAPISDGRMK